MDREETVHAPSYRYFVSATQLPNVGSFGREAQATYLYDKVRFSIETGESVVAKLYHLGRELQGLLAVVMEQLDGRWGTYCGATQMLITFVVFLFLSMSANSSKWIVYASPSCTRPNARFQYSCELQTDHRSSLEYLDKNGHRHLIRLQPRISVIRHRSPRAWYCAHCQMCPASHSHGQGFP